jgi:hypothetical protein
LTNSTIRPTIRTNMSRFNYKYENAEALCRIRKVANELGYDVVSLRDAKEFWEKI